jgi:hypothetical protein
VPRAVQQTLLDQGVALHRQLAGGPLAQLAHELADWVGRLVEAGERAQDASLAKRGPLEADEEEAVVEGVTGQVPAALHVVPVDSCSARDVPGVLAAFLDEVGVAERPLVGRRERTLRKRHVASPRRTRERLVGSVATEPVDRRIGEETLCVALRLAHEARQAGQSRRNAGERQGLLVDPVKAHDEGPELVGIEKLNLVEQEHHAPPSFRRSRAERHEQIREVVAERVGVSLAAAEVEADLEAIGVHHAERRQPIHGRRQ